MKVSILLLTALVLSACNMVVTTPEESELTVVVDALPGRWYHVESSGTVNADEYVDVIPIGEQNHYNVVIYEKGREDGIYQISLCPAEKEGDYWGFARVEDFTAGYLLFHLDFTDDGAVYQWLDADRAESMLVTAGLPFELESDTGIVKLSTLKIHASWKALLKALNASGEDVLGSDKTLFRAQSRGDNGINPVR